MEGKTERDALLHAEVEVGGAASVSGVDEATNAAAGALGSRVARTLGVAGSMLAVTLLVAGSASSRARAGPFWGKALLSSAATSGSSSSGAPHIVLVTVDDAGWNDFGYQSTDLEHATPHMNALAAKGVILGQHYSQPSCTPARAALLSGLYVHRIGFQDTEIQAYSNYSIPLRHSLLPARLSALNYRTVGLGKWNVGHCAEEYLPWNRGFDYFLGYMTAAVDYRTREVGSNFSSHGEKFALKDQLEGRASDGEWRGATWTLNGTYDTLLYTRAAVRALDETTSATAVDGTTESSTSSKPLFLWVAYHGVHADDQADVTDAELLAAADELPAGSASTSASSLSITSLVRQLELSGVSSGRIDFARALYAVDHGVGAVVGALERGDALDNAVIVVHSDNGGMPCTYGGLSADLPGNNWPLRSAKFQYYEGGVRVPAFVYAPGLLPSASAGTTFSGLVHITDWMPTFLRLAGTPAAPDSIDGIDQWDALGGDTPGWPDHGPRDEIVFDIDTSSANRSNGWDHAPVTIREDYVDGVVVYRYREMKLLRRHTDDTWYGPSTKWKPNCTAQYCQLSRELMTPNRCGWDSFLFNLTEDPTERTNLIDEPSLFSKRAELETRARKHFEKGYYQPLNRESSSSHTAQRAFYKAGGFVAPWADLDGSNCQATY